MKTEHSRRKGSPYPELFRIRVAKEYLAGEVSRKELATKYCLEPSLISHWVRNFVRQTGQLSMSKSPKITNRQRKVSSIEVSLERELSELKKELLRKDRELKSANLQILALDTMIDVAEEIFEIPIRKKSGPKQ